MAASKHKNRPSTTEALSVPRGPVDLASYDTNAKPGFDGNKKKGKAALFALGDELSDLQERLFAEGMSGGRRRVLLVLQGMDTSGKGGIVRHSVALVDPQGLHIKSFKAPTRPSCGTGSSGGSNASCPSRASSACSTAPITRTC